MSKRHPQQRSRSRTSASDGDDVFVAGVLDASTWARKNQSKLTIGGIVVAVILLGGWYWTSYTANLEEAGLVELEQIQQTLSLGDAETGKVALAQYLERFGGTPYAAEASLLLAELYLETNQPAQAIETLRNSGVGLGDPLGPQVHVLQARAWEEQGEFARAAELYLDVGRRAPIEFQRVEALSDAARMRTELGQFGDAIAIYDEILATMEVSDAGRGEFEMRKAELEARG